MCGCNGNEAQPHIFPANPTDLFMTEIGPERCKRLSTPTDTHPESLPKHGRKHGVRLADAFKLFAVDGEDPAVQHPGELMMGALL